jgi:acetyltransferase-like isoleucine patch superfamily enzyme
LVNERQNNLITVKSLSGVFIDADAIFGDQSGFITEGALRVLQIEKGFSCRNFCNFLVYPNASLIIHANVFFNNYCSVNCLGSIEIGAETIFGEGVKMYDHNHLYAYDAGGVLKVERQQFDIGSIKIGKNCWIGSNVTILNNVEIGDNVIIGANCLIYKSIPSNSIVKHKEELIVHNQNTREA